MTGGRRRFAGDGKDDFLVAEPGYDGKAGADCGRVRLFGGSKGSPKVLATWEGSNAGDRLGEFVHDVLDGDGDHEFAIGSSAYPSGTRQGCVDLDAGKAWAQGGDDLYLWLTRRTA